MWDQVHSLPVCGHGHWSVQLLFSLAQSGLNNTYIARLLGKIDNKLLLEEYKQLVFTVRKSMYNEYALKNNLKS